MLPIIISLIFVWYSYGFTDPALARENSMLYALRLPVSRFLYGDRISASILFIVFFILAHIFYGYMLRQAKSDPHSGKKTALLIVGIGAILLFSYPLFSYDIFNYILTGKVLYFYRENPYVTMPIELAGEPMLFFTRAANKVALYGPVWLVISMIPYVLSLGNLWAALILFKFVGFISYAIILFVIWKKTHVLGRVVYIACNPLIFSEILANGHNDSAMMALALLGIYGIESSVFVYRLLGYVFLAASVFVKGATAILIPVVVFTRLYRNVRYILYAACMFLIFLLTPFREEMYPWYAAWFLVFLPFLEGKIGDELRWLGAFFSAGLLLRHLPYVMTREYGGGGPALRMFFMWTPLFIGLIARFIRQRAYEKRNK